MAALDTTARQEGHKAMEEAISAAARVRRQLKAGRPRKTRSLQLNTFEAMGRIVNEADRARGLMRGAGLDPSDENEIYLKSTVRKLGRQRSRGGGGLAMRNIAMIEISSA